MAAVSEGWLILGFALICCIVFAPTSPLATQARIPLRSLSAYFNPQETMSGSAGHKMEILSCVADGINNFKHISVNIPASSTSGRTILGLSVLEVRFMRWVESVGMTKPDTYHPESNEKAPDKPLRKITGCFTKAQGGSRNPKSQNRSINAATILTMTQVFIQKKLNDISASREQTLTRVMAQSSTSTWTLYIEDHLENLLKDLCQAIDNLEQNFPGREQTKALEIRNSLCAEEISLFTEDPRSLEELKTVIERQNLDPLLECSIPKDMAGGNLSQNVKVLDGGKMQNGSNSRTGLISTSKNRSIGIQVRGKDSKMHNGDNIGTVSFWASEKRPRETEDTL